MGVYHIVFSEIWNEFEEPHRRIHAAACAEVVHLDAGGLDVAPEGGVGTVEKQQVHIEPPGLEPWQQVDHQFFRPTSPQRGYDMEDFHIRYMLYLSVGWSEGIICPGFPITIEWGGTSKFTKAPGAIIT